MFQNNLIPLTGDPTLPDLLPEDPMLNDLFRIDDLPTPIIHPDIAEINRKLEHLTLETNTQGLRIAVERAKRQRLQATIRQVKQDLSLPCPDLMMIKSELDHLREHQNAINYQLDGETARTNTLSFRSLSRICQILVALIPCLTLPSESSSEVKIFLQELNNTIQQFGVHYAASYVNP